jgi:hypothetical protein
VNLKKLWSVLVDGNLRRYYFQRRLRNHSRRERFAQEWARKIGRREFGASSRIPASEIDRLSRQLSSEGYAELGRILTDADIQAVRKAIDGRRCYDAYDRESDATFLLPDAPRECHAAYYQWQDFISIPALLSAVNDPGILSIAQNHLGGAPTLSDVKMWWSLLREGRGKENQQFHRDVDDYRFCKLFIYLTDVDGDRGPHVYVPRTSSSEACQEDRRYEDEEITKQFGGTWVTLVGPKGTAFLVNTYGLHKGLAPKTGERLIFVAQFSLLPIGLIKYAPVAAAMGGLDPYVNRLFLKPTEGN